MITLSKGIGLLHAALPYNDKIINIDLSKENAIYFDWKGYRYKFDLVQCKIMISRGSMLSVTDSTILMTHLIEIHLNQENNSISEQTNNNAIILEAKNKLRYKPWHIPFGDGLSTKSEYRLQQLHIDDHGNEIWEWVEYVE